MTYLEGLLREDVLRAVEGLSIGRDNYQNALDILEERFGTKNIIVSSVMDTLVSLTRVRDNDLKSLRKLYDSLEIGIRNLENMEILPESYGNLLVPIVKKKLPPELNLIINRASMMGNLSKEGKVEDGARASDILSIKDLQKALKFELEAREGALIKDGDVRKRH